MQSKYKLAATSASVSVCSLNFRRWCWGWASLCENWFSAASSLQKVDWTFAFHSPISFLRAGMTCGDKSKWMWRSVGGDHTCGHHLIGVPELTTELLAAVKTPRWCYWNGHRCCAAGGERRSSAFPFINKHTHSRTHCAMKSSQSTAAARNWAEKSKTIFFFFIFFLTFKEEKIWLSAQRGLFHRSWRLPNSPRHNPPTPSPRNRK